MVTESDGTRQNNPMQDDTADATLLDADDDATNTIYPQKPNPTGVFEGQGP